MDGNFCLRFNVPEKKSRPIVGHGAGFRWIDANLDISEQTVRNYMSIYAYRDKTANFADLQSAYKQIENLEKQERMPQCSLYPFSPYGQKKKVKKDTTPQESKKNLQWVERMRALRQKKGV